MEITSLEQLDAIRYDLDGNGLADSYSDAQAYAAAFPEIAAAEACKGCAGYELAGPLDFQHPGSYASGEVNPAWLSGSGWMPIAPHYVYGSPHDTSSGFKAVFDGNGHTISNLYVRRTLADDSRIGGDDRKAVGLFGVVHETGILRRIGMVDVDVGVTNYEDAGGLVGVNGGQIHYSYVDGSITGVYGAGGLTGENYGTILASYTRGSVSGEAMVGGLSGYNKGEIVASYTKAQVSGGSEVGGLVGYNHGKVLASYAANRPRAYEEEAGGLIGARLGVAFASYWDTQVSGHESSVSSDSHLGISGLTTSELQQPTQAAGIYELWRADLDNADGDYNLDTGREDVWDFGDSAQYPALKVDFNGDGISTWWEFGDQGRDLPSPLPLLSAEPTPTHVPIPTLPIPTYLIEYDSDGDGLIEINNLEQLDAIRYDLDGNGIVDDDSTIAAAVYGSAFPTLSTGGLCSGDCKGYELARSLDFRKGSCYASGVVNESWVSGSGWLPIGSRGVAFNATFNGNEHSISGLYINRRTLLDSPNAIGLFGVAGESSFIHNARLIEAQVTGLNTIGGLAGVNEGQIVNSHVQGSITSVQHAAGGLVAVNIGELAAVSSQASVLGGWHIVGGLVSSNAGVIRASYATGNVSGNGWVGGLIGTNQGQVRESYATGYVYSGWENSGGLIGVNSGAVVSGYATGKVCGGRDSGGLVGVNTADGVISDSYATGSVNGSYNVGGLLGTNGPGIFGHSVQPGKVTTSYSVGAVSGVESVGGFIGANGGIVLDSAWDSETSMQLTASGEGVIEGAHTATTADLQSLDTGGIFANWIGHRWDFGDDNQYPALKADMDGNGTATWQEFGSQSRVVPASSPPAHCD